nr:hypothetical protein [Tanacetum cinerariifolium]
MHKSTPRAYKTPTLTAASPQGKKRKQSVAEMSAPEKSLKVTIKQKQVVKGEKEVESYVDKFVDSMIHDDADDFGARLEPENHKENLKVVDDDDDVNDKQKQDESKDDNVEKMNDVA